MNAKIVALEDHPAHSSAINRVKAEKIFNALTSHTLKYAHALMQGMFDRADDTLFDMAEKAESNSDQAVYFDSMRIIRLKRKDIENSFCQQIENLFNGYLVASSSHESVNHKNDTDNQSDFSCDNLSLMDDFDLEESLAISTLSDKIRSHHSAEIQAIEKRLAHMKPELVTNQETNPFDARNICSAFQQATQTLETEIKIKLIVFKLFDQHISQSIGQLYHEINSRFVEAGILAKIKLSNGKASSNAALSRQEPKALQNNTVNEEIIKENTVAQNTSFTNNQSEILIPLQQILAQAHFTANSATPITNNTNALYTNTGS
ncbi:MAG: DUF1631 domain-containing protein, partial [Gammaproteobacteria bacterium]|nr:DUF1631 domain-containing protein [Gammaproteobacteria bacterium]